VYFVPGGAVHLHLPSRCTCLSWRASRGSQRSHGGLKGGTHTSWFNASSAMAFLAWFGGTGYLLTRRFALASVISLLSPRSPAWQPMVVFRFMVKLVSSTDAPNEERRLPNGGSLGPSHAIRRAVPARSFLEAGVRRVPREPMTQSIEKAAEVVIERLRKGIAYVKRWEEFSTERVSRLGVSHKRSGR